MKKIFDYFRPGKKDIADPPALSKLRKRTEKIILTDKLSDEVKNMVEEGSGCGFMALLRVLRLLDSPILSSRDNQIHFIESFKKTFKSLDAGVTPGELVEFSKRNNLGIEIVSFYYNINLARHKDMLEHLSSAGSIEIDFPVNSFRKELFNLVLESNQVAIVGLERTTENGKEGHYLCSDQDDIFQLVNPGGQDDLVKYLSSGFEIADIIVFNKKD